MPSLPVHAAFLALSALSGDEPPQPLPDSDMDSSDSSDSSDSANNNAITFSGAESRLASCAPWGWDAWKRYTDYPCAPWAALAPANDRPWNTEEQRQQLLAFRHEYLNRAEGEARRQFVRLETKDNNSFGRKLWHEWITIKLSKWCMNSTFDAVLSENKFDPYSIMRRTGSNQIPSQEAAQIDRIRPQIAEAFFGHSAFSDDGVALKEPANAFVSSLLVQNWGRLSTRIGNERKRLRSLKDDVETSWQRLTSLSESNTRPKSDDVRRWARDLDKLTKILNRYNDRESLEILAKQRKHLYGCLEALGVECKGKNNTNSKERIPKALKLALEHLATTEQISVLANLLRDQLDQAVPTSDDDNEEDEIETTYDIHWREGVEEFQNATLNQLYAFVGVLPKNSQAPEDLKLHFMNSFQDISGATDAWSAEGKEASKREGKPLRLRWHQLVGITKMLMNGFDNKPVLLMDQVGLGKTIQVAGLISALGFLREHYERNAKFPGCFAEKSWQGNSGNIPNHPSVLVVPVTLVDQTIFELHKYLLEDAFDVLPYLGTWEKRQNWWSDYRSRSKTRLVIVTTPTAIQSDFDRVLVINDTSPTSSARPGSNYKEDAPKTIFGHKFMVLALDEAHNVRNLKKAYRAAHALGERAALTIAMTATPGVGKPSDLWNLGRCLRLEEFSANQDHEFNEMESRLRSAKSIDSNRLRKNGRRSKLIKATATGDQSMRDSKYQDEVRQAIDGIRERFVGICIRRDLHSVDNEGNLISGLNPIYEHPVLVKLYDWEMSKLDELAGDLIQDGTHTTGRQKSMKGHFFLHFRLCTLHPSCTPLVEWDYPKTIEAWEQKSTRKLDVLVTIISHHLKRDGQPPLTVIDDRLVPSKAHPSTKIEVPLGTPCDKIVVFCAFPKFYVQMTTVLDLYGIESLRIDGQTSSSAKTDAIKKFNTSGRQGVRVLIVSNVAQTGLNLPCANTLINLDRHWTLSEANQMKGRLSRPPQPKPVHVYNIIAANTHDVYLNSLSSGKGAIMDEFTKTPRLETFFDNTDRSDALHSPHPNSQESSPTTQTKPTLGRDEKKQRPHPKKIGQNKEPDMDDEDVENSKERKAEKRKRKSRAVIDDDEIDEESGKELKEKISKRSKKKELVTNVEDVENGGEKKEKKGKKKRRAPADDEINEDSGPGLKKKKLQKRKLRKETENGAERVEMEEEEEQIEEMQAKSKHLKKSSRMKKENRKPGEGVKGVNGSASAARVTKRRAEDNLEDERPSKVGRAEEAMSQGTLAAGPLKRPKSLR